MAAGRKKKIMGVLVVWLFLALGLLLAPSPREWGKMGRTFSSRYDKVSHIVQPVCHVVLMALCAFFLMQLFSNHLPGIALLYATGLAMSAAVGLELMQNLLPSCFGRQCDLNDLLPSLAGVVLGGMAGICIRTR